MTVVTYSAAEQRALLERYMRQGSFRAMAMFGRHQWDLEKLMLERTMGIGLEEYGDSMFHKSLAELKQESREEGSDLIAYQTIYTIKELGVIP